MWLTRRAAGNPGTGKTFLASSVLKSIEDPQIVGGGPFISASYFFSYAHDVTRNPRTAWSLMLCRLLDKFKDNVDLLNVFSFAAESRETYALEAELVGLFQLIAYRLPQLVFVIDGLDESNDPEKLAASVASVFYGTEAKAIVFSRPNIGVLQRSAKRSLRHIDLIRDKVDPDVRLLLETRLSQFESQDFPSSLTTPQIVSILCDSANGMILWAKLMVDYLRLLPDATARAEALGTLAPHEELIDVYTRILKLISKKMSVEREMAKRVFLYLTYPDRHLNTAELWEVTQHWNRTSPSPGRQESKSPTSSQLEWFHSTVLVRCGSLVEKKRVGYGFVHQSVLDFFWGGLDSGNAKCQDPDVTQFLSRPVEAHYQIAIDCLTYLSTRYPSEPLSGDMRIRVTRDRIHDCLPFATYAASLWPVHLKAGADLTKQTPRSAYPRVVETYLGLFEELSKFISNKLAIMAWIELQYTASRGIQNLDTAKRWSTAVEYVNRSLPREYQDIPTNVQRLCDDLYELDVQWGRTLIAFPSEIWGDLTAYFPSRFLHKTSALDVYPLGPSVSNDSSLSSNPLAIISRESNDKLFNATLSLWSPR